MRKPVHIQIIILSFNCFFLAVQVAEVAVQEGQKFDLSIVLHLVSILSSGTSDEGKGFICIVRTNILSFLSFLLLFGSF